MCSFCNASRLRALNRERRARAEEEEVPTMIEEVDQPKVCVYCDKPVVNNGSFVRRHNGWICADCYREVPYRTIRGKLGKAEPVIQPKEKPLPQLHLTDIVVDESYEIDTDDDDFTV